MSGDADSSCQPHVSRVHITWSCHVVQTCDFTRGCGNVTSHSYIIVTKCLAFIHSGNVAQARQPKNLLVK